MKKEELIIQFEKEYKQVGTEMGLKVSLEELDRIFYLKNFIMKEGFVSESLMRQICYRIIETYMGWNEYLHSLIMPNPQNMLNMSESKVLNKEEKQEIIELMKRIMEFSSRNSVIGLTENKKEECKFIEDVIKFWNEEFKEKLTKIMKKINMEWGRKNENA